MELLGYWLALIYEFEVGQVSDGQVVVVLDESGGSRFVGACEEVVEIVEGLSQGLDFLLLALHEDFEGEHLVGGVVFGDEGHSVAGVGLGSCCEVASFDCELDVAIEVLVEQFRAGLISFFEAVLPVALIPKDATGSFVVAHFQGLPRIA